MAYLSNLTITVDAILTKKGRELLSKGQGFNITQFAVADDEVDYTLYTTAHPLGTAYYGAVIENMPIPEASPDETQSMRYKLVTLPRGTKEIPVVSIGITAVTLTAGIDNAFPIRPSTSQGLNGPGYGYTAILYDADAAILVGSGLPGTFATTTSRYFSDASTSNAIVQRGLEFTITPKDVKSKVTTQLVIVGNQSGAQISVPVIINPKSSV